MEGDNYYRNLNRKNEGRKLIILFDVLTIINIIIYF